MVTTFGLGGGHEVSVGPLGFASLSMNLGIGIIPAILCIVFEAMVSVMLYFVIPYSMCVDREMTEDDENDLDTQALLYDIRGELRGIESTRSQNGF